MLKGIILNIVGFIIVMFLAGMGANIVVTAIFGVIAFLFISFGFYSSYEYLDEADGCLLRVINFANMAFSGFILISIFGCFMKACGAF